MKKIKTLSTFIMASALLLSVYGCGQSPASSAESTTQQVAETVDLPADPTINPDHAQYWRETLQNYRKDDKVRQIMLVRYTGGCNAIVQFYTKNVKENNTWSLLFEEEDAYVGKYGIGKTKEGDAETPNADLGVLYAFGIRKNPGTKLDYIDVTPSTFACDEDCEYYNQIIDIEKTGHQCTGEEMYLFTPEYNYGFATDYNPACDPALGSAIFIHCKGAKPFTGGCVALDEKDMVTVLKNAESGMRVVIAEN